MNRLCFFLPLQQSGISLYPCYEIIAYITFHLVEPPVSLTRIRSVVVIDNARPLSLSCAAFRQSLHL
jgi:hypothetical protein